MTEAELQEAYPPRKCGDGARCNGAILQARLNEVGLHQSYGWKAAVVWECPECPWRRVEPLKATEPVPL